MHGDVRPLEPTAERLPSGAEGAPRAAAPLAAAVALLGALLLLPGLGSVGLVDPWEPHS